jgi:hypothetical protein
VAKPSFIDTIKHGWKPPDQRPWISGEGSSTSTSASGEPGTKESGTNGTGTPGRSVGQSEILAKREALAKQLVELQWDLGGITYEMARRDHYRLDVLNKRAAELQKVDGELGQVERLLKMEQTGTAGECPTCGALAARGAVFCWQCGNELTPETKAE